MGVLLWDIYQRTGFYYDVQLMPDGAKRKENLLMLLKESRRITKKRYLKDYFTLIDIWSSSSLTKFEMGEAGSGTEE